MLRQRNFYQLFSLAAFKAVDWPETSLHAVQQGSKEHRPSRAAGEGRRTISVGRQPPRQHASVPLGHLSHTTITAGRNNPDCTGQKLGFPLSENPRKGMRPTSSSDQTCSRHKIHLKGQSHQGEMYLPWPTVGRSLQPLWQLLSGRAGPG